MVSLFMQGLLESFMPVTFAYIVFGVVWGIIGGAIPGISASVAMSLLLPFTYSMDPLLSLPMLSAVYVGAEYGGSIPAILIKTPGTGAAAATVLDGYEMQRRGEGGKALGISLYAGVVGGLVSVIVLVFSVIPLARFALKFGPTQYFWMSLAGLSIVGAVSGNSPLKGIISAAFGLFLATVGMDSFTSVHRFTFGIFRLSNGLELIPVLVGLFALSEVFRQIFEGDVYDIIEEKVKMSYPSAKELKSLTPLSVFCGVLGAVVGALPGAGATIASWLGYSQAKLLCKNTETFGTGDMRGVAAPESANNGVPAGALIPLLALGVPGSNSTAILMAGFGIAGIAVGPMLFVNQPEIPYKIMGSMFVAQIAMLFTGMVMLKPAIKITSINKVYLTAAIIMFAIVGAFSTLNDVFAAWMVVVFGLLGFVMKRFGFAPAATVLGFVLGELVEDNVRRAFQLSRGSADIFFQGTINIVLIAIVVFGVSFPYITQWWKNRSAGKAA